MCYDVHRNISAKISGVNLSALIRRLSHEDFFLIIGTNAAISVYIYIRYQSQVIT